MIFFKKISIWVILIILLMISNKSIAQTNDYNEEFRVNTYTQNNQGNANLLKLTEESFVACWQSYGQDGSDDGIYAQLFKNDGEKIGDEFRINSYTQGYQWDALLLKLSEESFVACWISDNQDGSNWGIYAQIFKNNGEKFGEEFRVNNSTQGYQRNASLLKLTDESFIVSWQSYDISSWGIYAQIFNNNGEKIGDEFRVNTYTQGRQLNASLFHLTEESFIVCWESLDQDGSGWGVYAQIIDNNGEKTGEEFRLNTYTQEDQKEINLLNLNEDSFVVCWHSSGQDGSTSGIYAQIFSNNGEKIGDEFRINNFTQGYQSDVSLLKLNDECFLVCWGISIQDDPNPGVYAQILTNDGVKISENFKINTYNQSYAWGERLLKLTEKSFIVCWHSRGQDGFEYGIHGQICNNSGEKIGEEFRVNNYTQDDQIAPRLLKLTEERFVVSWGSYGQDGSENGIYGKIYLTNPVNHVFSNFEILQPENDDYLTTAKPKFIWESPSNQHINFQWEISYNLYLSENESFEEPIIFEGITDTIYQIDSLEPGKTYFWKVLAKNYYGDSLWSSKVNGFFIDPSATDIEEENLEIPKEYSIAQNYPNPFNPTTTIKYSVLEAGFVTIKVYDILGREIAVLVKEYKQTGTYKIKFDGSKLSSGVYLYRIISGNICETRKMVLSK